MREPCESDEKERALKLALNSPVVIKMPGTCNEWEEGAGIAELAMIVEEADRLGYDHVTCSEHVMVPEQVAKARGGTYWDPLATFGYLAARTTRIRFATQVLVLGYHHPLAIAKRYGTLDVVSGGRLVLGLGVGTLQEEFDMLGATFEGRGAIADDALRALRAALASSKPRYDGPHFSFSDVVVEPNAQQERVPLWVGGRTPRSLRRASTLADGWVPFGLSTDQLRSMLDGVDLPVNFEVVLSPEGSLDPMTDPAATLRALEILEGAGATIVSARIAARSADHYREQLNALAELAGL